MTIIMLKAGSIMLLDTVFIFLLKVDYFPKNWDVQLTRRST